jgi:hypothetical protein
VGKGYDKGVEGRGKISRFFWNGGDEVLTLASQKIKTEDPPSPGFRRASTWAKAMGDEESSLKI